MCGCTPLTLYASFAVVHHQQILETSYYTFFRVVSITCFLSCADSVLCMFVRLVCGSTHSTASFYFSTFIMACGSIPAPEPVGELPGWTRPE